ncbi:leucine-rich repeat domain-containing protein [Butyrivibrio fibrisolvens]|uniref:leucine-rich repeat domain-containing protein n=1 Tax=Butyrivibrio fibrisolvens TaxID=831 RepID=UPI0018AD4EDC|nr:leucine-rich repeat domain-containing protein [Butyrivibrio fibrisolvens]
MPLAVSDYKISFNEGSITLVEYVGEDSELIIPERILGIPVRHIGPHCFSNAPKVISITIPDKMTIIDESAFSKCKNLESIYARNIEIIGEYAFNDDKKLKNVELGDSIKIIGKGAFFRCESFEKISLNDGIESIGDYAFIYSGITDISGVEKADIIGTLILNYTPWEENQKSDFVIIKDILEVYKGKSEIVVVPDELKVIDCSFDVEPGYDYPI